AVRLPADVLARRQVWQVAREVPLLTQDPRRAPVYLLLHLVELAALRRDDRHPQVGVHVDGQRPALAEAELVLDTSIAILDSMKRHPPRPSRFLATSTSCPMMLSTVSSSSGLLSPTA